MGALVTIYLSWVVALFRRSVVTAKASYMRSWLVKMTFPFSQNCVIAPTPQGWKAEGTSTSISNSVCWESFIGLSSAPLQILSPHTVPLHRYTGTYRQAKLDASLTGGSHCGRAAVTDNTMGGWIGTVNYRTRMPSNPLSVTISVSKVTLAHS